MSISALPLMPSVSDLYRYDRIATVLPSPDILSDDVIAAFQRDGFVAFENVLLPDEIAAAQAAVSDLIHGRVPDYKGIQPEPEMREHWPRMSIEERADSVRKLYKYVNFSPTLNEMAHSHPTIQAVLERLIGEPCRLIQDMALLKPPHVGTEKPWHQDMAYFKWGPPERIVGVWIALDPATADNGCMHVLPGTQREGAVPHFHVRDCQIADNKVEVERDQMVPLKPGGALFFSALLHHGTPPNHSPSRRRALQFHYAAASCRQIARQEHADLYFDGDAYAGCVDNWGEPITDIEP